MPRCFLILLALASSLSAQIFADFTVSYDGQPLGTFEVTLEPVRAPRTTANFIGLASGERPWIDLTTGDIKHTPFYDGLTFHRLIHNFVIQGGSPNGAGTDSPGFSIQDEFHPDLRHSGPYVLSMAKSSLPASGGAQFFITLAATPNLDDKHSIFGTVTAGREIIDGFMVPANFPTGANDVPNLPIVIESVTLRGYDPANFDINDPALRLPHVESQPETIVTFEEDPGEFTLSFDREAQTEYPLFGSVDLTGWEAFSRFFSSDSGSGSVSINVNQTAGLLEQAFARLPSVNYGTIVNAPGDFTEAGKIVTLTNRENDSITLNFDGAGGGTWTDSEGNSGNINIVAFADGFGTSGTNQSAQGAARLLPLLQLSLDFDSPAGPDDWDATNLVFSFHEATSGFVDGQSSVTVPGADDEPDTTTSVEVLWSFTYQP